MRPTSLDLRQRIIDARLAEGLSLGQLAQRFRRPPAFACAALKRLERDVLAHPDATLAELLARSGVKASRATVHHTLRRLGFTRKKNATCQRAAAQPSQGPAPGVARGAENVGSRAPGLPR
jgi:transposase